MRSKKTEKKTSNKKAMATSGRSVIGVDISPSHIRIWSSIKSSSA